MLHFTVLYELKIAIAICQLIYPVRHVFPVLYAVASDIHLDALAAWLRLN